MRRHRATVGLAVVVAVGLGTGSGATDNGAVPAGMPPAPPNSYGLPPDTRPPFEAQVVTARPPAGGPAEPVTVPTVPADAPAVRGGTGWFRGARTVSDGSSLLLTFTGSTFLDRTSPCWQGYEPEVKESASEVRVTIHRTYVPREPVLANFGCTSAGLQRTLVVPLSRPIGARELVDGAESNGGTRQVFDGQLVLQPAELPEGWTQTSEEPRVGSSGIGGPEHVGWHQSFSPPSRVVDGACANTEHALWLWTDTPASPARDSLAFDETLLGRPEIRGQTAVLIHRATDDVVTLSWTEGAASYQLRSSAICYRSGRPDPDFMARFAQSLRTP